MLAIATIKKKIHLLGINTISISIYLKTAASQKSIIIIIILYGVHHTITTTETWTLFHYYVT